MLVMCKFVHSQMKDTVFYTFAQSNEKDAVYFILLLILTEKMICIVYCVYLLILTVQIPRDVKVSHFLVGLMYTFV